MFLYNCMVWLVTAVILLLAGHYVKVLRWRLFIELYERADISVLLKSLSVAHVINFIVPFHVGDLYRILYSGRRMGNGIKFSFATIVVEHYIDLIVLAILCAVLYALGHNTMGTVVLVATVAATVVLLTVISIDDDIRFNFQETCQFYVKNSGFSLDIFNVDTIFGLLLVFCRIPAEDGCQYKA